MKTTSFEGLEVNSPEYKRVANRRFYLNHKEEEKARAKKWRLDNPEKYKAWAEKNHNKRAASSRKFYYGITLEEFNTKMDSQNSQCVICGRLLLRPSLDHNHACCPGKKSCGKCIRGILCQGCNTIIGLAGDSIEVLNNAIQYLKGYQK